jgi:RimJ/RimL family protein N-acetyltransferase
MTNPILLNIPEIIKTNRLLLRIPKNGDGPKVHAAVMDGYDDYVRFLSWSKTPPTLENTEQDCRQHHADFIMRNGIRYLIMDKQTHEVIGRVAFPPFLTLWNIPQFGISYFIRSSMRGHGYGTEATHALTYMAFTVLSAKKVFICCEQHNHASIKIPLSLGFQLEFTQRGGWLSADGQLADLDTYSMFDKHQLPKNLNISWD